MSKSSGKIGGVVEIRPSLLAADFGRLAEHAREALDAGAHALHADVMDGSFVPPITYGPDVVKAVIDATGAVVDAHLMIVNAERQIDAFAEAGVRGITVHAETERHLHRVLSRIREFGLEAGVALNPATPIVPTLRHVIPLLDRVLIMSVNPGWGGQSFIPQSLDKVRRVRRLLGSTWSKASIQVDGGVSAENAGDLVRAGATELVAGTAVFQGDVAANIATLRKAIEAALTV
jgi:ribulose-phosphate 3-epimerase